MDIEVKKELLRRMMALTFSLASAGNLGDLIRAKESALKLADDLERCAQ